MIPILTNRKTNILEIPMPLRRHVVLAQSNHRPSFETIRRGGMHQPVESTPDRSRSPCMYTHVRLWDFEGFNFRWFFLPVWRICPAKYINVGHANTLEHTHCNSEACGKIYTFLGRQDLQIFSKANVAMQLKDELDGNSTPQNPLAPTR